MLIPWLRRAGLAESSLGYAAQVMTRRAYRPLPTSAFPDPGRLKHQNQEGSFGHVPFVNDGLTSGSDDSYAFVNESASSSSHSRSRPDAAGSITVKERAAFASLFDKASRLKTVRNHVTAEEAPPVHDAFGPESGKTTMRPTPQSSLSPNSIHVDSFPTPIQDLAARAQGRIASRQRKDDRRVAAEQTLDYVRAAIAEERKVITTVDEENKADASILKSRIDSLRESHYTYVEKLLVNAKTDTMLWAVLKEHVFDVVAGLRLDQLGADSPLDEQTNARGRPKSIDGSSPNKLTKQREKKNKKKRKQESEEVQSTNPSSSTHAQEYKHDPDGIDATQDVSTIASKSDLLSLPRQIQLSIMGANYSTLLTLAIQILTHHYPTSDLFSHILPATKSLGRASYILGASTPLYNTLIRHTYNTNHDFAEISRLLDEMESAALEFDDETVEIVYEIRKEGFRALRGEKGSELQGVWKTDVLHEGWRGVVGWWPIMRGRLGGGLVERQG